MTSKKNVTAKKRTAKRPKTASAKAAEPKKSRIGVLIADDHSVVREGLASLIGRRPDMTVVGEAANGREAVDLWKKQGPDVTLLDLRSLRHAEIQFRRFLIGNFVMNQVTVLPYIIAGIALLASGIHGLYWIVPGVMFSLIKALLDAWVLLVEVHR